MGFEQDTLIYVEQEDKSQASAAARGFAQKNIQNRAYINTLGARLAMKYLASEDINISNIYNIHSIKKILEEIDVSDVMLPNIHIDVRVVFDENVIFIPKSHFEYNLVPDIYLVFHLAKDISHVKFLGFFEPKLINKNNSNSDYYFIEKEKLSPAVDLKKYIENFNGSYQENVTEDDIVNSERIIIAMSDNDITDNDKKYLIQQLTKSAELRDKFIEYENFENLSYQAMTDPMIERKPLPTEQDSVSLDDISDLETIESPADEFEEADDLTDLTEEENIEEIEQSEDVLEPLEEEVQPETPVTDELSISDDFADLGLEPIDDFSDISLDDEKIQTEEFTTDNDASEGFLDTAAELGKAAALTAGAAAAAEGIAAAEGTVEAIETGAQAINAGMEVLDKGIEIADDLISTDVSTPEPLSLDDVDTSMLDNIDYQEEEIENETISLNDVEVPVETEHTDFIDKIDNKISLDDIKLEPLNAEPENLNIEEETISLKDVDTTGMEIADEEFQEETISLDNVDTSSSSLETPETDFEENIISFDNVDEPLSSADDDFMDDVMSFDDVEEPEQQAENSFDEIEDNSISFEEADEDITTEPLDSNVVEEELPAEDIDNMISEPLETPEMINDEVVVDKLSDEKNSNTEAFGKNLLNNLSPENLDNISIDDLGLSDDLPSDISDDISSSDLLSQIDDLLNSDTAKPVSDEIEESIQPEVSNAIDDELPSIEESLLDTEIIPDEIPQTQDVSSSLDNLMESDSDDEMPDTAIDELLNFEDEEEQNDEDKLGVLFNDTDTGTENEPPVSMGELNELDESSEIPETPVVPGAALYNKPQLNKKVIIVAAALVTVIAAASAVMLLKPKGDSSADIEPLSKSAETEVVDGLSSPSNVESTIATNVPELEKIPVQEAPKPKAVQTAQPAKELKSAAPVRQKPVSSESYLTVNRLVWDVPDALSYSPKMQNYLRTAGKSIKLSLSADLLLATEYAYTNQVKVNIKLSKDGTVQEAKVASGSGSDQIDKIVLQSVKDTLNVVKPPSSEIKTPDFNLSLIIYF